MKANLILLITLFLLMSLAIQATEVDVGFDSQYISEGRNQISSGGIHWISTEQNLTGNIALSFAYGLATDSQVNYDELNIAVAYSGVVAGLDYALGYTRLEFFRDNQSDDELTLALAFNQAGIFTPFSNIVYSVEANGFFVELGGMKEFLLSEQVSVSSHLLVAYDFGYTGVSEDGYNHTSIGTTLIFAISDSFSISGIAEKTFAGNIIKSEGDKAQQFWAGAHLTYSW